MVCGVKLGSFQQFAVFLPFLALVVPGTTSQDEGNIGDIWEFIVFDESFAKMSNVGVSKNNGTPKSSILIGFSIVNHPFWGTPIFGNTHVEVFMCLSLFVSKLNSFLANLRRILKLQMIVHPSSTKNELKSRFHLGQVRW